MNAFKSAIARIDTALNMFWIGVVLRRYHEAQAARFSRLAERLAHDVANRPMRDYVSHQACRHMLEVELLQGKV